MSIFSNNSAILPIKYLNEFTTEDICLALTQLIPLSQLENNQTLKLKNWAVSGRIRLASSKSISLN